MKRNILIFGMLLMSCFVNAQTIENLRTEQSGEKIIIYYKINGSNPKQFFKVTLSCQPGSKEKFELKSVTGDVGDKVPGGKTEYKAIWDVLKDVDELTDPQFFAELTIIKGVKPKTTPKTTPKITDKTEKQHNFLLAYNGGFTETPIGIKIGFMSSWGGYMNTRFGANNYIILSDSLSVGGGILYSFTGGVTKRLVNTDNFKLHLYAGAGYGRWGYYSYTTTTAHYDDWGNWLYDETKLYDGADYGPELDYGVTVYINRFAVTAGATHLFGYLTQTNFTAGIGFFL